MIAATRRADAWPEFDRWQAVFAEAGVFPARWDGLHAPPAAHTPAAVAYRLRKLALLAEWLEMLARRAPARRHYARRGIRVRAVRQDTERPCPGCDPFNARALGPGLDALPPFHPGCRCVLVTVPTAGARRPARLSGRLRSRLA